MGSPGPDADAMAELPVGPSIAVPFNNLSNDPEQEYFSGGFTEVIITELSKLRDLLVIARHSSFAYKGDWREAEPERGLAGDHAWRVLTQL